MLYIFLLKRLQWRSCSLVTHRLNFYSTIYLPVDCNSDSYLLNPRSGPNLVQTRARNVAPNEAPRRQTHWYAGNKGKYGTLYSHIPSMSKHVEIAQFMRRPQAKQLIRWSGATRSLFPTLCSLRCYLIKQKQFNLIFIHATGRAVWGPVYHDHFCHFCA